MLYRRKTLNKEKQNNDIHEQLVKLSKQNQYLHTKLESCQQQIQQLNVLKDKYKHKYKRIKSHISNTNPSEDQYLGVKDDIPTKKQLFKDDNPYSLKKPIASKTKCQSTDVTTIISRIRDSLCQFIQKISDANRKLDYTPKHHNKKQVCSKLDFLACKLDDIVTLINNKKEVISSYRESRLKSQKSLRSSQKSGRENGSITPIKKGQEQYRQANSLAEYRKQPRKRQRSYSQRSQYWKILKQIGTQLRDWKVGLFQESRLSEE